MPNSTTLVRHSRKKKHLPRLPFNLQARLFARCGVSNLELAVVQAADVPVLGDRSLGLEHASVLAISNERKKINDKQSSQLFNERTWATNIQLECYELSMAFAFLSNPQQSAVLKLQIRYQIL